MSAWFRDRGNRFQNEQWDFACAFLQGIGYYHARANRLPGREVSQRGTLLYFVA
jgi:hypothetical protein